MRDSFNKIEVTAKFNRVYVCSKCRTQHVGKTEHLTFTTTTPVRVAKTLIDTQCSANHMPVGWSFDGRFKCPKCIAAKYGVK